MEVFIATIYTSDSTGFTAGVFFTREAAEKYILYNYPGKDGSVEVYSLPDEPDYVWYVY